MNCPNCNHTAQPGHLRCGHCNFKLPANLASNEAPAGPGGLQFCWNCRHGNPLEAQRCTHCNVKLDAHPAPARVEAARPAAARPAGSGGEMRRRGTLAPSACFPTTLTYYKV
jgi:hypothetical protein